jgi:trimethylamine--corrinoid protein Co-methyltransferase
MLQGGLQVFADSEAEQVHAAVLRLLRGTGCRVVNERMRALLARRGALVDESAQIVLFPHHLVEEVVAWRHAHRQDATMTEECRSGIGGAYLYAYDWARGERSRAATADIMDMIRAGDALPEISSVSGLVDSTVDPRFEAVETMALLLKHSRKPGTVEPIYPEHVAYLARLAEIFTEGGCVPQFFASCHSISTPLAMDDRATRYMFECLDHGAPCGTVSQPVSGATAPVTIAGAVVLACAEILAVWMMGQAVDADVELSGGVASGSLDMRTMEACFASPEAVIQDAGVIQVFEEFFGGGVWSATSWIDAKVPGLQATFEKTYKQLGVGAAMGRPVSLHAGLLDAGATFSGAQAILDLDLNEALWRYQRGAEVDAETVALEMIEEVGIGGSYLEHAHTLRHFREAWYPQVLDRRVWRADDARAGSEEQLLRRADERWRAAVAAYEPLELDRHRLAAIDEVVTAMHRAMA